METAHSGASRVEEVGTTSHRRRSHCSFHNAYFSMTLKGGLFSAREESAETDELGSTRTVISHSTWSQKVGSRCGQRIVTYYMEPRAQCRAAY